MCRSGPSPRSWSSGPKHAAALLRAKVIVHVTIHDKMSTLWRRGAGGEQLRKEVWTRYGTSCHRFYTRTLEQVGISEIESRIAYKSPRAIHRANYTSRKHMLNIDMELFIISAQGISPRVVIWLWKQRDSLRSMVLTAVGIPQTTTSTVGDVPEKRRHKSEWV